MFKVCSKLDEHKVLKIRRYIDEPKAMTSLSLLINTNNAEIIILSYFMTHLMQEKIEGSQIRNSAEANILKQRLQMTCFS